MASQERFHIAPASDPDVLADKSLGADSFTEIPIIDLEYASGTSSADLAARRKLADNIRDACTNVGFFYVKNHGVPENMISAALEAAHKFFSLPLSIKMELDIKKSPNFKGYTALLGENSDPENDGDLHEGFDIGWESDSSSFDASSPEINGAMAGHNVWPENQILNGFREDVLAYYHAVVKLGKYLFPLFALALDLPENFFDDKTTKPAAIMRLLYYPPQTIHLSNQEKVMGIGAHTDYECFTILWQDNVQALQVLNASGKWIDAVPIPGTFVVNLGDQFARWTNDKFKSTVHRAINRTGTERYSIPLFFGSDYNVKLEPIPSCVSPENPPKYEVVTAGDYVKSRLEATFVYSKSTNSASEF